MKRFFGFAMILAFLSVSAFAAKNSQTVKLSQAVTVAGTQLPAGQYKVSWTGTGSTVQVTFKQEDAGKSATATVPAKLVQENHDRPQVTLNSQGGVNTIELVDLKNVRLVLSGSPEPGQ